MFNDSDINDTVNMHELYISSSEILNLVSRTACIIPVICAYKHPSIAIDPIKSMSAGMTYLTGQVIIIIA